MPDEPLEGVNLLCGSVNGKEQVLPNRLSMRAHGELTNACLKLKAIAADSPPASPSAPPPDTSATRSALSSISPETWNELRDIAGRVVMLKSRDDPSGVIKKKDPMSLTEGQGIDVPIFLPIKISGNTKMKVFLNVDPSKMKSLDFQSNGIGTSIQYKKGGVGAEARLYMDTMGAGDRPIGSAYLGFTLDLK